MKRILALFFIAASFTTQAQNQMLTTEDIVLRRGDLTPTALGQLNWIKGTNAYYYVKTDNGESRLMTSMIGAKSMVKELVTLTELNDKIRAAKVNGLQEQKKFPRITWNTTTEFSFAAGKHTAYYNIESHTLRSQPIAQFPENAANQDEAPKSGYTAYTVDNNLYVMKNGASNSVTEDKEKNIVNGQSVHRDEFGISKGTYWSPSGTLLAFYRMDQTMVTDYPILDLTKQPATAEMIKYPMAGATSHQVTIGVYNAETGTLVFLKTGEPKDQYLTNIAWSPDNKKVYVAILNRDQNELKMNCYNAETGAFEKTLFVERSSTYVHPMHPMMFVPQHNDLFLWQSERDGMNHVYLYNTKGELVRPFVEITKTGSSKPGIPHNYIVTDMLGCDPAGKLLYVVDAPFNQIGREVRCIELSSGKETVITSGPGTHNPIFNETFTYFIDDYSDINTPRLQRIIDAKGIVVSTLHTATNPLVNYKPCTMRLFSIKAADGKTPLWCKMLLPADFDSTKKYPSMTYVYNGPNVQLVTNTWMAGNDMFLYYMAQQGFVVFTVDGRGSDGRGTAFEQATFKKLGTVEMDDQEQGANYLKSLSYVDSKRMAVFGWSFGGFMTTSLMTRKAGLYKTGVAGGPVIDWSYYEVMYTERYMDTPETNKAGYDQSNLTKHAGELKGKLLLIHGTSDDVVVWQHSLMFIKSCVDQGTQPDYFVYPGHLHNVRGKDRAHLYTKVAEYIKANT